MMCDVMDNPSLSAHITSLMCNTHDVGSHVMCDAL